MATVSLSFSNEYVAKAVERIIKNKATNAVKDPMVNYYITREYRDIVKQYIPLNKNPKAKTFGQLENSGQIVQHGYHCSIEYEAIAERKDGEFDYAPIQYKMYSYNHRPGRYDHWNRHISDGDRKDFYQKCSEIITEAMQNE